METKTEYDNKLIEYLVSNNYLETFASISNTDNDILKKIPKSFVTASIDIGYGNTKYAGGFDDLNQLIYGSFPSLSPLAPSFDLSGGDFGKRNTKIVEVNNGKYEVGVDSEMASVGSDTIRVLNDTYVFSEQYKALYLGALSYLNLEHINVLVMGLPVKNMHLVGKIENLFTGTHNLADGVVCTVDKVVFISQPLGGFYEVAIKNGTYEEMLNEVNLVIDPGYLTFDFLLLNGLIPSENRSDAMNGGMSRILINIAKSLSNTIDRPYDDYNAIDKALRTPKKMVDSATNEKKDMRIIKIGGKVYDLLPHIYQTAPVIDNVITAMRNKVQNFDDVDNIILVGGPESIYGKKIKENLHNREILKSSNPLFSNVIGFYFRSVIILFSMYLDSIEKDKKLKK